MKNLTSTVRTTRVVPRKAFVNFREFRVHVPTLMSSEVTRMSSHDTEPLRAIDELERRCCIASSLERR
jgi:hypothetical protein